MGHKIIDTISRCGWCMWRNSATPHLGDICYHQHDNTWITMVQIPFTSITTHNSPWCRYHLPAWLHMDHCGADNIHQHDYTWNTVVHIPFTSMTTHGSSWYRYHSPAWLHMDHHHQHDYTWITVVQITFISMIHMDYRGAYTIHQHDYMWITMVPIYSPALLHMVHCVADIIHQHDTWIFFFLRMLFSNSSSHLQLSGGKPYHHVIVHGNDALFTVGWPVLWAGLDDMVHSLFWVAAIACSRVLKSPAFHSSSKMADTTSEVVERSPFSAWEVFTQQPA